MTDATNPIPKVQPGDSDDVELALETAQRLHRTGDSAEALKWLRRAVNAADEAGDDRRQLELARAAADYTTVASVAPPAPVASVAPPAPVASVAPKSTRASEGLASAVPTPSQAPQSPAKQPPPAPSVRNTVSSTSVAPKPSPGSGASVAQRPRTPASSGSVAPHVGSSASVAPPKPKASDSIPPAPRVPSVPPAPDPSFHVTADSHFAEEEQPALVQHASPVAKASRGNSMAPERGSVPPSGLHQLQSLSGSMRVAVKVSARDERLYIVRPLAPGQRLPVGTQEALLVFDEADVRTPAGSVR